MTHNSPILTQNGFLGKNDDGSESAATAKAAVNNNWTQNVDETFRIRIQVEEINAASSPEAVAAQLQVQRNALGYNNVGTASSVARAVSSTFVTNGSTTTQQIGSGSFVAGEVSEDGLADTVNPALSSQRTEFEFVVQIVGNDVANGDTIRFQVTDAGTALGSYTQTPAITAAKAAAVLTADAGAATVAGQAAGLDIAMPALSGSVVATGQSAGLDITMPAVGGSVTVSGSDAAISRNIPLAADAGTVTIAGQDVAFNVVRGLGADAGAITVAGQDASLGRYGGPALNWFTLNQAPLNDYPPQAAGLNIILSALSGSVVVAGQDAGLTKQTAYVLAADAGSVAVAGQAASLTVAHTLTAAAGALTVAGQAATLVAQRTLTAEAGAATLTGQDADLSTAIILAAASGSVVVSGSTAEFRQTYALAATAGGATVAGQPAGLSLTMPAGSGAVTVIGQVAGLSIALTAVPGSVAVAGQTAALAAVRALQCAAGATAVAGQNADLFYATAGVLPAGGGFVTIAGNPVTFKSDRVTMPDPGAVIVDLPDANIWKAWYLSVDPTSLTVAGSAAALRVDWMLEASGRDVVVAGADAGSTTTQTALRARVYVRKSPYASGVPTGSVVGSGRAPAGVIGSEGVPTGSVVDEGYVGPVQ